MPAQKRQRNNIHKHTNIDTTKDDAIHRLEEMVKQLKKENAEVKKAYASLKEDHRQLKTDFEKVKKENLELKMKKQEVVADLDVQKDQTNWYFDIIEQQSTDINKAKKEQKKDKAFIKKLQEDNANLTEVSIIGAEKYRELYIQYKLLGMRKEKQKEDTAVKAAEDELRRYWSQIPCCLRVRIASVTRKYNQALKDLESAHGFEQFLVNEVERERKKRREEGY
ncbi:hypothetical protein BDB01DRAFT_852260 [Pilobolus umbonatus]|nr:hypothetical protein BDB01DRAFT_852260 [Pilobolus umbonatus]